MLKHLAMIQTIAKATDATISALHELAVQFRAAQLFAHEAHNLTSGPSFHEDHEFFGAAYGLYDGYYDAMVERMIGLNGSAAADVRGIQSAAVQMADSKPSADSAEAAYRTLLDWNKSIGEMIDKLSKEQTMDEGVRDLIVGIANELQVQSYKIQQRLGGDIAKSGTSEGARKGWETRRAGGGGESDTATGHPVQEPQTDVTSEGFKGEWAVTRDPENSYERLQSRYSDLSKYTTYGRKPDWDKALDQLKKDGGQIISDDTRRRSHPGGDEIIRQVFAKMPSGEVIRIENTGDRYQEMMRNSVHRGGPVFQVSNFSNDGSQSYLSGGRGIKVKDGKVVIGDSGREFFAKSRGTMGTFDKSFTNLGSFKANIGKAGKGWYHGNQHESGTTSVKAEKWVAKMRESRECAKSGSALNSKAAEVEAMAIWKKMAIGERQHAMEMLSDNASEDIGKARDNGFEFGHGRSRK